MTIRLSTALMLLSLLTFTGCGDSSAQQEKKRSVPFVKTATVTVDSAATLGLSGTVRARIESPLAFQVGGRIANRFVDNGQQVKDGQILFELDKQDLEQTVRSARAEAAAAKAALDTAAAELARNQRLLEKKYVSDQSLERSQLAHREAQTRLDGANARLTQALNAQGYGSLKAAADGVLIDVVGEPGQVLVPGQVVATLAHAGDREIEVYFPEGFAPPAKGEALFTDERAATGKIALKLREMAGAVDPQSHTLRARYILSAPVNALTLGAIVQTCFVSETADESGLLVPIGALDERGQGPRVWRFHEGSLSSVAVTVLAVNSEYARIKGPLAIGDHVVALGTHLLNENMVVQELPR